MYIHVQADNDTDVVCVWGRECKRIYFTELLWGSQGWIWPNFASLVHTVFFPVTVTVIPLLIVKKTKSQQVYLTFCVRGALIWYNQSM